jgi:hypothetical protein
MNALLVALLLTAAPETKPAEPAVLLRGEKLKGAEVVELARLLKSPGDFEGKTVTVEAKVRKACEKKGCWMELSGGEKAMGVRVTFKDYGFFVPLDSAGKTARVEGVVKVAQLDEARAKHYEAEGATVPKSKDGKYTEVQLVASGVELR